MTERHAVALRAFTIATIPETRIADGQVMLDMDGGQFGDFEVVGLVREATEEEVASARAGQPIPVAPAPVEPAPAPLQPTEPVVEPDPVVEQPTADPTEQHPHDAED